MLRIPIASLKPGYHTMTLTPTAEALDLAPDLFADITVEVALDHGGRRILVRFEAEATAALTCDRTLADYEAEVAGTYQVLFAPPEMAAKNSEEVPNDDVRPLYPADTSIDVTDAVRDTLLLALPTRRIAPGAEDLELQLQYGASSEAEPAIDPRWAALQALRDDEPQDRV